MGIQWRDDLKTGIDLIDRQHRELFRRLNLFLDACDAGKGEQEVVGLLQFLDDYIAEHFADEERLQEEIGFVFRATHRKQHQRFMQAFTELKRKFLLQGPTPVLVAEINRLCVGWLLDHIAEQDRMFGQIAGG